MNDVKVTSKKDDTVSSGLRSTVRSFDSFHLLFHFPSCPPSRQYIMKTTFFILWLVVLLLLKLLLQQYSSGWFIWLNFRTKSVINMFRSFYSRKSFIANHLTSKSTAALLAARFSSSNVVVSFKKVTFGYTDVKMLLEDVSFSIREGK